MAGRLNFTIRDENGNYNTYDLWTGVDHFFSLNKSFHEGKYTLATQQFLKYCTEEDDELELSELAPSWYGLIVLDFKDKVIHSMQHYNEPFHVSLMEFSPYRLNISEIIKTFNELFKLNSFNVTYKGKNVGSFHDFFGKDLDFQSLSQKIKENSSRLKYNHNGIDYDLIYLNLVPKVLSEFKINYYEDDDQGKKDFQNELLNSQFKLSSEEKTQWDNFNNYK